jgi:glycosyltransferase involved in cell wall biosynthesis
MQIVHLTPTFFNPKSIIGGGERYVGNVTNAIHRFAEKEKISLSQKIISLSTSPDLIIQDWGSIEVLKNDSGHSNPASGFSYKIDQAIAGADIVHIYQSRSDFGARCMAVAKSQRLPVVTTDLGGGEHEIMLKGGAIELSNCAVSISQFAKNNLSPYYRGDHRVIIGPVDTDYFKPTSEAGKRPSTEILCVGRILPHKGVDRIIRALPQGMRLRVVGEIYSRKYYRYLRFLSLGKNVEFIQGASDEEIRSYYRSSSVLVQASTHLDCYNHYHSKPELMGLTTLEALACGLPVIVSDAGSLPELAVNKNYSAVFKNENDLKEKLLAVKNGQWPIEHNTESMYNYVYQNYGDLHVGSLFLDIYQGIIKAAKVAQ